MIHPQAGDKDGYGFRQFGGKVRGWHIASLMAYTGEEPLGRHALHTCDNPRCINPKHLWWGDHTANMQDMAAKGRNKHQPKKLTSEQEAYVLASGATSYRLAKELAVNHTIIDRLRARKK